MNGHMAQTTNMEAKSFPSGGVLKPNARIAAINT